MILPDVNVLVYALRDDAPSHADFRRWLEAAVNGPGAFGLSDLVLSGVIRVLTHPRVFDPPSSLVEITAELERLRSLPNCVVVSPGPRHWSIFTHLCVSSSVRGNLVPDTYFAALALESGCEWITTDRDYSRFKGLTWRHPLA